MAPGTSADLLAWLRAPGLLRVPALADALERELRRQGHDRRARARALWEQRNWPLEAIDELQRAQAGSPAALIDRAGRELARLLGAPLQRTARPCWTARALDEARAHAAAARALRELRELAVRAPELAPADASALAGELEAVEFLGGEPPGGEAVAVLDPLALRARRVRALFLCGLQEGVFPSQRRRRGPALRGGPPRARAPRRPAARPPRGPARRRALPAVCGRLAPRGAARAELAPGRRRRPLDRAGRCSWRTSATCSRSTCSSSRCAAGRPGRVAGGRRGAGAARAPGGRTGLRDERVLAELAGRPWSASSARELHRLPHALVRRAGPAPGLLGPRRRAAAPRRARPRGAEGHARGAAGANRQRQARRPPTCRWHASCWRRRWPGASPNIPCRCPASACPGRGCGCGPTSSATSSTPPAGVAAGARAAGARLRPAPGGRGGGAWSIPAFELGDGVVLRGRIDRVDLSPSGDAVVVDYKNRVVPHAVTLDRATARCRSRCTCWPWSGCSDAARWAASTSRCRARTCAPAASSTRTRASSSTASAATSGPERRCASCSGEALSMARSAAARARRGELEPQARELFTGGRLQLPVDLPVSLTAEQLAAVRAALAAAVAVGRRRQRQDGGARRALRGRGAARTA